jgi:hypothetical protein
MNTKPAPQTIGAAVPGLGDRQRIYRQTQPVRVSASRPVLPVGANGSGSAGGASTNGASANGGSQNGDGPNGSKGKVGLLRCELGDVLRSARQRQRRTLRDVSAAARVSLGYLSEVERGHKEASSELLASICEALEMPLWATLREVADRMAIADGTGNVSNEVYRTPKTLTLVR